MLDGDAVLLDRTLRVECHKHLINMGLAAEACAWQQIDGMDILNRCCHYFVFYGGKR